MKSLHIVPRRRSLTLWWSLAGAFALNQLCMQSLVFARDQLPAINAVYPSAAFAAADVRTNTDRWDALGDNKLLNAVTHFGAIGDGNPANATANTAAFRAMFDFVKAREMQHDLPNPGDNCEAPGAQWMMYIPDGIYYVDDTISYNGDLFDYFRGVRIIGQSRAGTVIKLVDNASGFGAGTNKVVLSFDSPNQDFNNWQGHNMLKNITIDVGAGNPGAIGVDYFSPNTGRIDNVTVRSAGGTNLHAGSVGINFRNGIVHGYFTNITVDGFDIGMSFVPYHMCCPTLEHITFTNQKTAAIKGINGGASFRKVYSEQSRSDADADAVGILIDSGSATKAGTHFVIIDSQFVSTRQPASGGPAIDLVVRGSAFGHLFARNVRIDGYPAAVRKGATITVEGDITEYVSDSIAKFSANSPDVSMQLPIEETPDTPWENDLSQWTSPDDFGAVGDGTTDDTSAVEQAMNANKAVVYFPKQQYKLSRTVTIPSHVKRVDLMATELISTTTLFAVKAASATHLHLQDLNDASTALLIISANRTLVLDSNRQSNVRYSNISGLKVFANNANKFGRFVTNGVTTTLSNMKVWGRFVNTEDKTNPSFTVSTGASFWVLGFKSESATNIFSLQNGGRLEILGGLLNQWVAPLTQATWTPFNSRTPPTNGAILNIDGHLSCVLATNGPASVTGFTNLVGDQQGSTIVMTAKSTLPARLGVANQGILPLYTSYTPLANEAFASYLATHGIANTSGVALADADGDGSSNWLEFALQTDPNDPASLAMPSITRTTIAGQPGTLVSFIRAANLPSLRVSVETSTDLLNWATVVDGRDGASLATTPIDTLTERVDVTLPEAPTRFFRLRCEGP